MMKIPETLNNSNKFLIMYGNFLAYHGIHADLIILMLNLNIYIINVRWVRHNFKQSIKVNLGQ